MFKTGFYALLILAFVAPSFAGNGTKLENKLKEYFKDTAQQVHNAESSVEKREILDTSLNKLTQTLDTVEQTANLSAADANAVKQLKSRVVEKSNELNGRDGFERVSDAQLDGFADYVQQDMEQADRVLTISVTTVLLIVIILLLI